MLSMSALTIVMLVVIVTTVADMDRQLPGSYVGVDPWAGWEASPPGEPYPDQAYADFAVSMGPAEEREPWPGAR
ncbi:MAG: hypothetical protein M1376_01880 [Planctomycetes bacterium]|nr:hypothetical protein [Planctomycetota bacterium]